MIKNNTAKKTKNKLQQIEEVLINIGLRIAKRGEGALFVIGEFKYDPLVNQDVPSFNILDNPKLLESLALMDGAVIIDRNGFMKAYGVRLNSKKTLRNFGTRHSAGISAAAGNNIVVLVSEEDRKIKILKKGKMIMQIDALQKNVENSVPEAVKLLESIGAGTIGAIGTGLIVPSLGVFLLPGIVVFGSAYYIGGIISKRLKHKES